MKRVLFLFLLLLPLASAVPAPPEGDASISLSLVYAESALPVSGTLTLHAHSDFESFNQPLSPDDYGEALLFLPKGVWKLEFFLDAEETPGIDYYGVKIVDAAEDSSVEVFLARAASIHGRVEDKEGSAVPGAIVSLDCVNSLYSADFQTSDEAGNYLFEFAPSGSCVITAISNGFKDSKKISIAQGSFDEVNFSLSSPVQSDADYSLFYALAAIAIAAILVYHFRNRLTPDMKKKAGKKKTPNLRKPNAARLKTADELSLALKSLSGSEKKTIEWLIAKGGAGKQSALQRELLMPKASLSRAVKSLERKGLVHCERSGKANSIRLSERFYAN